MHDDPLCIRCAGCRVSVSIAVCCVFKYRLIFMAIFAPAWASHGMVGWRSAEEQKQPVWVTKRYSMARVGTGSEVYKKNDVSFISTAW